MGEKGTLENGQWEMRQGDWAVHGEEEGGEWHGEEEGGSGRKSVG